MTMTEVWIASPNYSARNENDITKLVLHTTEGARTIRDLGNFFANPSAGVSSHFGADNAERGVVGSYVYEQNNAWTQGNANPWCLSIELCTPSGAASGWSRDYWLNNQETLLMNAAEWVAWMAGKYGIPIRALSNAQAQDVSVKGVCQHMNLGSWGGGHSDCGPGFPMDKVIQWATSGGGGSTPAPIQEADRGMSVSVAIDSKGEKWEAGIGLADGSVYYRGPGTNGNWYRCDNQQSGAKSGAGIAIDGDDNVTISYTNASNIACLYNRAPDGSWSWEALGGDLR